MTTYTCTRCGNATPALPENPYNENHPLGRWCADCLPRLFEGIREGKIPLQLITEAARYRRGITSGGKTSIGTVDQPMPEYENMQFAPPDWPGESKEEGKDYGTS